MGINRIELDKVYHQVKELYRREYRDKNTRFGIDVMYEAIIDYIDGNVISTIKWTAFLSCLFYIQ